MWFIFMFLIIMLAAGYENKPWIWAGIAAGCTFALVLLNEMTAPPVSKIGVLGLVTLAFYPVGAFVLGRGLRIMRDALRTTSAKTPAGTDQAAAPATPSPER